MIWMAYKYVYYRLYIWSRRMWGNNDIPEYNALLGVALLTFLNLFSLPFFIEAVTAIRILEFPKLSKGVFVLVFLVFILAHYFLLVYKKRYLQIEKEFKKENDDLKRKRGYIVFFYIIGSVVILFASWYVIYLRSR